MSFCWLKDFFRERTLKKIKNRSAKKTIERRAFIKNPVFYYILVIFILFFSIYFSCDSDGKNEEVLVFPFQSSDNYQEKENLILFSDNNFIGSPDLKIIQGNTLVGVSTPSIVTGKVLSNIIGSDFPPEERKVVQEYTVQPGDTLQSIADKFGISLETLLWANELNSSSLIKPGQKLIILPVNGVLHIVKAGDTISSIAQSYKAKEDDIIAFNELSNPNDIYIGDILIIPGGRILPKATPSPVKTPQIAVAESYFIFPTEGKISQGLHYYNAVDIANNCGTPIYAAASGVVQRVKYGWNFGGGNLVTILHSNGTVTYYGHLMTIFVKPGQTVKAGERIALMGGGLGTAGDGISTGCHLHFQVMGARNPLASYKVGTTIKYNR